MHRRRIPETMVQESQMVLTATLHQDDVSVKSILPSGLDIRDGYAVAVPVILITIIIIITKGNRNE